MTMLESTPVAYNNSATTKWRVAPRGASVSGNTASFGEWLTPRAQWLRAAADRLKDVFLLDSGWDGGVAPSVDPFSIQLSWTLLRLVAERMPSLPMPVLVPTANGGMVVEWVADQAEISIEISSELRVFYDIPAYGPPWEGAFDDAPINPGELLHRYFA